MSTSFMLHADRVHAEILSGSYPNIVTIKAQEGTCEVTIFATTDFARQIAAEITALLPPEDVPVAEPPDFNALFNAWALDHLADWRPRDWGKLDECFCAGVKEGLRHGK